MLFASAALVGSSAAHADIDVVQTPTDYFVPSDAQVFDSPYYRGGDQDWGWTHGPITTPITSADLNISAFDVDALCGFGACEVDNIYAYDNGVKTLLGSLNGADSVFAFTDFVLPANFYDDIANGLQVEIDIDTLQAGWFVTLAKSTLTTNGTNPGNPNPGVPEPATWAMMLAGVGIAGAALRRRNLKVSYA